MAWHGFENTVKNHRQWELHDGLWNLGSTEGHLSNAGEAHPFSKALNLVLERTLPVATRIQNAPFALRGDAPIRNGTLQAILRRVHRRTSEMASNLTSWYNSETPLRTPCLELNMEPMEMCGDVIRAAIAERNVVAATLFLKRTAGQILRMEDCVIELRLGNKSPVTVKGSLYLT
jgi:hypothetical protein